MGSDLSAFWVITNIIQTDKIYTKTECVGMMFYIATMKSLAKNCKYQNKQAITSMRTASWIA